MLQKMQKKFIAVVMLAYMILMTLVVGGINLFAYLQTNQKYDQILEVLMSNNGEFPDPEEYDRKVFEDFINDFKITVETKFENRYFLVRLDENGRYLGCNISHVAAVTEEEAEKYGQKLFRKLEEGDVKKGTYGIYRYRMERKDGEYQMAFVDMTQQLLNLSNIRVISIVIGLLLMFILFLIVWKLAAKAIHPFVESMEKQKRFITDAGHELKTPLAVISANADVLELTCGKNEWIDSIRNQTMEMNELVKRLLFLSKMEEGQQFVMAEFNLSETVEQKVKQISAIAYRAGKKFEMEIQPDIIYKGNVDAIEHMVSVLTENAVKYCSEEGSINVKLFKSGKTIHFEVRNSGEPLDKNEMNRLFERFYRPDSSRSRNTGGHGIGLSIAKAVADSHKGKIYAKNEPGVVAFCVEL